jgi:predicted transcriptional regulator
MKKEDLYEIYATNSSLKTYHYKVLLLLMNNERTQSEMCSELGITKQNINKICKDLLSIGYISNGKTVGRNKYLHIDLCPNPQIKGQVMIKDLMD